LFLVTYDITDGSESGSDVTDIVTSPRPSADAHLWVEIST
jgi:hypothetical protein